MSNTVLGGQDALASNQSNAKSSYKSVQDALMIALVERVKALGYTSCSINYNTTDKEYYVYGQWWDETAGYVIREEDLRSWLVHPEFLIARGQSVLTHAATPATFFARNPIAAMVSKLDQNNNNLSSFIKANPGAPGMDAFMKVTLMKSEEEKKSAKHQYERSIDLT